MQIHPPTKNIIKISYLLSQKKLYDDKCVYQRISGVNFTNILPMAFSHKIFTLSFFALTFEIWIFLQNNIGSNALKKKVGKIDHNSLKSFFSDICKFLWKKSLKLFFWPFALWLETVIHLWWRIFVGRNPCVWHTQL